jgi:hypothetical protein
MKKLKVYLDTSIINFLEADDAPDLKKITEEFFENIVNNDIIDPYISNVVIDEINNTPNTEKRTNLLEILDKYKSIKNLLANENQNKEIVFLAQEYMDKEIIPKKKVSDAFHVAYSTVFEMDVLLSWNFKHLANINKEHKILIVNKTHGYNYPFRMANPMEVF